MKEIHFLTSTELKDGTSDDQLMREPLRELGLNLVFTDWRQLEGSVKSEVNSNQELVILRSPWDYIHHQDQFLMACQSIDQLWNPIDLVKWNIHKSYLKEVCEKGLPIIPMMELKDFYRRKFKGVDKHVVKPYVSASSFETIVFEGELPSKAIEWNRSNSEAYFIQPFCDSIVSKGEHSFIFFNDGEKAIFSHATVKTPKSGDFRVQEEFGGSIVALEVSDQEINHARSFLSALEDFDWLYLRVDLVFFDGEWCLSELEAIEPDLYLRTNKEAPERLAKIIKKRFLA